MTASPERIAYHEEEPLPIARQREFLLMAYGKVSGDKMKDPNLLPAEIVQIATGALPSLIEENKKRLPPSIKVRLPDFLSRLEKWFAGVSAEDIAASEGVHEKVVESWIMSFPAKAARVVSWEDLLDVSELKGLVTPKIRRLGPRDILKHPKKRYKLFRYGRLMDVEVLEDSLQHTPFDWRAALYPLPGDERDSPEKRDQ